MRKRYQVKLFWMLMIVVLAKAAPGYAQSADKKAVTSAQNGPAQETNADAAQEERNFQLTFTARELDENGKVINTRRYDTMLSVGPRGGSSNIRTGAKVPLPTSPTSSQFTYMDVGANFDVNRPRIVKGNRLALLVTAEISSFDSPDSVEGKPRTIHQNRWTGDVEIPIGGRKVIFSADDLSSRKSMQIELSVAEK